MKRLWLLLLLVACKPPLTLSATYRVEPKGVRVDVRTIKGAEIHAPGETRVAHHFEVYAFSARVRCSIGGGNRASILSPKRGASCEK